MLYKIMIKLFSLLFFLNCFVFPQVDLNLNLELGKEYLLYQHNEISIIQIINHSKVRMYTEIDSKNTYQVIEKNNSSYVFEVTMGDAIFMMSSPYFNIYFNSNEKSTSAENLFIKMLRRLNGLKFELEMTYKGTIISTNFTEIITPEIFSLLDSTNIADMDKTLGDINDKINQMSPAKNLERITNFLPNNNVDIGDKWKTEGKIEFGIPIIYEREIEFTSETDSTITLESSSFINTYEVPETKRMLENTILELKGKEEYNVILSSDTKWFKKLEGKTEVSGISYHKTADNDTLSIPIEIKSFEYYGEKKY